MELRGVLEQLDEALAGADLAAAAPTIAFLAAPRVTIDEEELRAARRRALLVLAAGGDPRRELDPGGPPVRILAEDLETPERRAELDAALTELTTHAKGLPNVARVLETLRRDPELAWRSLACALLAEELAEE